MPLSARRVLRTFKYTMYFNGVNAYVRVSDSSSLNVNYITIYAWVWLFKWSGTPYQCIVNKYTTTGGYFLAFRNADKRVNWVLRWSDGSVAERLSSLGENALLSLHNIVLTYDGAIVKLFINNVLDSTYSKTGLIAATPGQPLDVGTWGYNYLNGLIPQVLIYSRALSADDIAWNFNYPDNPVRNGLVLWLKADPQYVKDVDGDGILEWLDLSGFGNHGKIYGAQLVQLTKSYARILQPLRVLAYAR